jgi:hypothetical protein
MLSFFAPLLSNCESEEEVFNTLQLINQLCIKFKDKAAATVDAAMIPFLQKILTIQIGGGRDMNSNDDGTPLPAQLTSDRTEQLLIHKTGLLDSSAHSCLQCFCGLVF